MDNLIKQRRKIKFKRVIVKNILYVYIYTCIYTLFPYAKKNYILFPYAKFWFE